MKTFKQLLLERAELVDSGDLMMRNQRMIYAPHDPAKFSAHMEHRMVTLFRAFKDDRHTLKNVQSDVDDIMEHHEEIMAEIRAEYLEAMQDELELTGREVDEYIEEVIDEGI